VEAACRGLRILRVSGRRRRSKENSVPARDSRTRPTSSTSVGYRVAQSSILTLSPLAAFSTPSSKMLTADSELLSAWPYLQQNLGFSSVDYT